MDRLNSQMRGQLISAAENANRLTSWPTTSWQTIRDAGFLRRSIPVRFGGTEENSVDRQKGMEEIAACCLTTAFIFSQREAAVRNLLNGPEHLKERYLPRMSSGEAFLTVGLSQLTTSRQHGGPALRATLRPFGGYRLNGEIPWVTGADQAAAIVAGATLNNGSQMIVVIPVERVAGMIEPALPLAALVGSRTSLIRCRDVDIELDCVLAGPIENVLGNLGGGGIDTSCLAIGLASAAKELIQVESISREELHVIAEQYDTAVKDARRRLHELACSTHDPMLTLALRRDCTKLALSVTQAALMITKGNGFICPHVAQRWARQALFFLVWSCPRPVAEGVLADLSNW